MAELFSVNPIEGVFLALLKLANIRSMNGSLGTLVVVVATVVSGFGGVGWRSSGGPRRDGGDIVDEG